MVDLKLPTLPRIILSFWNSPLTLVSFNSLVSLFQPFLATVPDTLASESRVIGSLSVNLISLNTGSNVAKSVALMTLPNEAF